MSRGDRGRKSIGAVREIHQDRERLDPHNFANCATFYRWSPWTVQVEAKDNPRVDVLELADESIKRGSLHEGGQPEQKLILTYINKQISFLLLTP